MWNSIDEMFAVLEKETVEYIILRNYEEIAEENFYTSGHADIDFLTSNPRRFANLLHAVPRFQTDDRIHYVVNISGTNVVLDIRSVGDGYYDTRWQRSMLRDRINKDGRFYVMDEVNYYYSLIYHAVLQKQELAEDYLIRLNTMSACLAVNARTETEHLAALERFMCQNSYCCTIPYDIWVPLRQEKIPRIRIKKNLNVYLRDIRTKVFLYGSRIKHFFLQR